MDSQLKDTKQTIRRLTADYTDPNTLKFPLAEYYTERQIDVMLNDARQSNQQKSSLLLSGFPCIGKTFLTQHNSGKHIKRLGPSSTEHRVIDLDSSRYKFASNEKETDFNGYLTDIEVAARLVSNAIVMVSCHEPTRRGMLERRLTYVRVCPDPKLRLEWVGRSAERDVAKNGRIGGLTKAMDLKWEDWTQMAVAKDSKDRPFDASASELFIMSKGDDYLSQCIGEILDKYGRSL